MRILLIEDEEKLAHNIAKGLENQGFAVDVVGDGETALTRLSLHRSEYDLAVLDLMLPQLDGAAVCKQLREREVTTPILVLTAKDAITNKVDLLEIGADDYVVKPFAFRELLARIRALLRRPHESKPTVLAVLDITLDPAVHTVIRGKKEIPLTVKEFALLEYFMLHPGEVVRREDILDHLWDFEFASFSNIVDVHVKNLRKKLGRDGGRIIETVRGVGYRMVV